MAEPVAQRGTELPLGFRQQKVQVFLLIGLLLSCCRVAVFILSAGGFNSGELEITLPFNRTAVRLNGRERRAFVQCFDGALRQ